MKRWIARIVAGLGLAAALLLGEAWLFGDTARSQVATAQSKPAAWQSMETDAVIIENTAETGSGPDATRLTVRIADDASERAQGMQNLPPAVVRNHPIWFVFREPRRTHWHMRNVRHALDIAYVDADGVVIGIDRMQPEQSGYASDGPISAALEVAAGEAERLGIRPGTRIRRAP
jgi:uncharacterized membrane protein (UPF0127 family)